jgi:polysaccharide biosynthesis transport protein
MEELAQYGSILKRRWLPATFVFLLITGLAAAYTMRQTPIYQSKGQLLYKKAKASSLLDGLGTTPLESLTSGGGTSNALNNQLEIIRSLPIIQGTIDGLDLKDKKGEKLKPEDFLTRLKVTNVKNTDMLDFSYQDEKAKQAKTVLEKVFNLYWIQDVESQRKDSKAAREFVEKQLPEIEKKVQGSERIIRDFREKNKVVDLPSEATKTVETVNLLRREITTATAQLSAEESRIKQLKTLLGPNLQSTVQTALVSEDPGVKEAITGLQEVQKKLALERTRFTTVNPAIQDLLEKEKLLLSTIQQRRQKTIVARAQTTQGKPAAISSNDVIEIQKSGIQEGLITDYTKAEAQKVGLEQQIAALMKVYNAYDARSSQLPQLEEIQRGLARQLDTSLTTYKTLKAKLEEFRIAENQTTGNVSIVTPPTLNEDAVSPKNGQNIAIGSFLGLFLGAASAFILDSTDRRIKTAQEAQQLLPDYPILGRIPDFQQKEMVVTSKLMFGKSSRTPGRLLNRNSGSDQENEAFRSLQANLRFLNADSPIQVIVVSSSLPREGKSTVAANLALVTAELGRTVLLVDGDMRKPSQHRIWRQNPDVGLSNVLTGQSRPEDAIIEVEQNLFLLTAGVTPPNPIALIDSSQMGVLVGEWSKTYDLVIIDAPPLTVAADATLLSKQANGIVFVLRPNVADKDSVMHTQEILKQSEQNVLGLVLNGIPMESKKYNDYYYTNNRTTSEADAETIPVEGIRIKQDS